MVKDKPDRFDAMTLLREWQEAHDQMDEVERQMQNILGIGPDSPIREVYWRCFEKYTHVLGRLLGDSPGPDSWLEWYWLENEMGVKGHDAGYDGDMQPVEQLQDLEALLNHARKIGEAVTEACVWTESPDHAFWQPACRGDPFTLNDGTPEENHLTYCHHCGRIIIGKPSGEEQ